MNLINILLRFSSTEQCGFISYLKLYKCAFFLLVEMVSSPVQPLQYNVPGVQKQKKSPHFPVNCPWGMFAHLNDLRCFNLTKPNEPNWTGPCNLSKFSWRRNP